MDTKVPDGPNARFQAGDVVASAFANAEAADLAANAADITLIIDKKGVIRDAALPGDDFEPSDYVDWVGHKWIDLVRVDSTEKVTALLSSPGEAGERRWRQVNHVRAGEPDLPLRVFSLSASKPGWTIVIGRDMRSVSRMQQRLLDAQQSMEREYARVREAETRFRLLFQIASEGVVVLSGANFKVTDANPAAARLLGRTSRELEGASVEALFGADAAPGVREILAVSAKTGRPEHVDIQAEASAAPLRLTASVFRQGQDRFYLCRLSSDVSEMAADPDASLTRLAEILPDGLVLTGEDGKIVSVNEGFIDIAQLHGAAEAVGQSIDQFLGRTEVEFNVLLANLREHGVIRHFATTVRSRLDIEEPVEVSAVSAPGPSGRLFGFSIRPVGRRVVAKGGEGTLPSSVDQLSDLVGRVALKDIVRESTDIIESSCIEAALELTNDNRASAAEILGLSRQSLYAKMHRHKIGSLQSKSDS